MPTGVLSLSLAALFFIISRAVFCAVPRLTERLEEARETVSIQEQIVSKDKYPSTFLKSNELKRDLLIFPQIYSILNWDIYSVTWRV